MSEKKLEEALTNFGNAIETFEKQRVRAIELVAEITRRIPMVLDYALEEMNELGEILKDM